MKLIASVAALCAMFLAAVTPAAATTLGLGSANSYGNYLGEAIAPYNGTLDGNTIASGIICLDININSYYNTSWTVSTAAVTTAAEQRAAWLALQLFSAPAASRGALTMAIWYTMNAPGTLATVPSVTSDAATMSFVTASQNASLNTAMFSNVAIYSPTNTTNQRFMALTSLTTTQQTSATPEPGSFVLLFGGAAIMFRLRKRLLPA